MTIAITEARRKVLSQRLSVVFDRAAAARDTQDLSEIRRELNALWFAIHDAHAAVDRIERDTREEALRRIGEAA